MTYLIAEIGATHTGFDSCLRLAKAVSEAGFDALKVQAVYADDLTWPDDKSQVAFGTPSGVKKESVREALQRRELTPEQWCDLLGECLMRSPQTLEFIASASNLAIAEMLVEAGASIKVMKGDQSHAWFIARLATMLETRNNRPGIRWYVAELYLDGRERMADVASAVQVCETTARHVPLIIVHCPSGYPAPLAGIHLAAIPVLRQAFPDIPIGYTDHSLGADNCLMAMALGATVIEKTVSEDPTTEHVEHFMSLSVDELPGFVKRIRQAEMAMGRADVIFQSRVEPTHRRGIYAARDLAEDHVVTIDDIAFKRPEKGRYAAADWEQVVGKTLARLLKERETFDDALA